MFGYHTETDRAREARQQVLDLLSCSRVDWLTSEVQKLTTKQETLVSTVEHLRDQAEKLGSLVMEWTDE